MKTLGDKMVEGFVGKNIKDIFLKEDVKQFIKKLKEDLFKEANDRNLPLTASSLDGLRCNWVNKQIDKHVGDALCTKDEVKNG